MLKKVLEHLPVTTIFIAYLYICGGLYLVAYWSVFDIDIFPLISLIEIPKSFIFPFIISQGFLLLQFLLDYSIPRDDMDFQSNSTIWYFMNQSHTYLLLCGFSAVFLYWWPLVTTFWFISGGFLGVASVLGFSQSRYIREIIKDARLRRYLAILVIFTPITCFVLGKSKSIQVRKNISIKYIRIVDTSMKPTMFPNNDSIRFKLLGFLGEKAIVSTLENEKIYILNQSAVDVFEMEAKSREE